MTLIGHIVGTKGNTGRGIASIVENADYTITINLTDGTSYTTAPIAGFTDVAFDENYDLVVTKTDGTTETVPTDIEAFREVLEDYKDDAETAETNASGYADNASGSATTATEQATLARSYARGDTSSRTGEATDNADYYRGLASSSASSASSSASSAETQALKSEGYAVGKQNGTSVASDSPYYHNNAEYYSDLASTAETNAETAETNASTSATNANADALKAEGYAVGKQNGTTVISGTYYHNNAMYYNSQATNMASLATNKANSAGTDALKAEGFAVGEQNGTPVTSDSDYYENNAKYYAEQAETSAQSLVIEDALDEDSTNVLENGVITKEFAKKANVDGAYESMTVGNAEQLISSVYVTDEEPYQFRTSGGSADIGDREFDTLVGGSVAWNQLANNDQAPTSRNGVTFERHDDYFTMDGTATSLLSASGWFGLTSEVSKRLSGHKVLVDFQLISGTVSDTTFVQFYVNGRATSRLMLGTRKVIQCDASTNQSELDISNGIVLTNVKARLQVIDLTAMFGSTIADYIYSLEQATAGAGVAFFRKYFPNIDAEYTYLDTDGETEITKKLSDYQQGVILSVEGVSAHKTVGFNAWDEEWESGDINIVNGAKRADSTRVRSKNFVPVIPNATYYCKSTLANTVVCFYDKDKNWVSSAQNVGWEMAVNTTFIVPQWCHYIMFYGNGTTYNNDICINLSWDGERNGEYEPYVEHSYPLDDSLTLRGIPKIANGKLYYDGDTYPADGTVDRQYVETVLDGSNDEDWGYTNGFAYCKSLRSTAKVGAYSVIPNVLCDRLETVAYGNTSDKDYWVTIDNTKDLRIKVGTAITDVASARTWLASNPLTVVYERDTPTTETADPFTNPQIVDDFGTEEYITTSIVPVGHSTKYTNNLKAKLEMSPESPSGDGLYLVQQSSGQNAYVQYISPVPSNPSTDGTYVLKATVSGGTATLTWVAE